MVLCMSFCLGTCGFERSIVSCITFMEPPCGHQVFSFTLSCWHHSHQSIGEGFLSEINLELVGLVSIHQNQAQDQFRQNSRWRTTLSPSTLVAQTKRQYSIRTDHKQHVSSQNAFGLVDVRPKCDPKRSKNNQNRKISTTFGRQAESKQKTQ